MQLSTAANFLVQSSYGAVRANTPPVSAGEVGVVWQRFFSVAYYFLNSFCKVHGAQFQGHEAAFSQITRLMALLAQMFDNTHKNVVRRLLCFV